MEEEWGEKEGEDGDINIPPSNRDSRGDANDRKGGDLGGGTEGGVFAREGRW